VVRGNKKSYVQFINYNFVKSPDNIYFEDIVAKAILFRAAEKIYGVKPNSIGDMRYITVPYSISLFSYRTNCKLDLYKIWKNQSISEQFKTLLYDLMIRVEASIRKTATEKHGDLYGEWAKKEECWNEVKKHKYGIDFNSIKQDFEDPKNPSQRKRIADEETAQVQIQEELEKIKSVPSKIWNKIEDWGRETGLLSEQQKTVAYNLAGRVRNNTRISDYERHSGIVILDTVIEKAPELLDEIDELNEQ
ncbi:MAG: AIPR family protein, partial [Bacteroidota bacterium]